MARLLAYALLGVLVFVAALVWSAPALLLARGLPDNTGQLSFDQWRGSLWQGAVGVQLSSNNQPMGTLRWQLQPGWQPWLQGPVTFAGDGLEFAGGLALSGDQLAFTQGNGMLRSMLANIHLNPYDIRVSGDLELRTLDLALNLARGWPSSLAGTLLWPGGPVNYRVAGQDYASTLPPLVGSLTLQAGNPLLVVTSRDDPTRLLELELDPEGWLSIRMTRRMAELAGFPWQGSQNPDSFVLEVQEQLH